jgi:hypothetical protein
VDFCSHTCRQRAYEQVKWQRPGALVALEQDLATVRVRDAIRAEVRAVLAEMGITPPPPPPAKPRRPSSHLRVVQAERHR